MGRSLRALVQSVRAFRLPLVSGDILEHESDCWLQPSTRPVRVRRGADDQRGGKVGCQRNPGRTRVQAPKEATQGA
jgi:hypothetical protein